MSWSPSTYICVDESDIEVERAKYLAWSNGKDYGVKFFTVEEARKADLPIINHPFGTHSPIALSDALKADIPEEKYVEPMSRAERRRKERNKKKKR